MGALTQKEPGLSQMKWFRTNSVIQKFQKIFLELLFYADKFRKECTRSTTHRFTMLVIPCHSFGMNPDNWFSHSSLQQYYGPSAIVQREYNFKEA